VGKLVHTTMKDKTKIADATYVDDVSGLKLDASKQYTVDEIALYEAKNITKATLKYLSLVPDKKLAPFSLEWFLLLHKEMFGEVWEWAGKLRHVELSIGIKAYIVSTEMKKLVDDVVYWEAHQSFDVIEIAARVHHRAVQIHPFLNGNGRWSRMLANIYLKQHGLQPTTWNENLLSKENLHREEYIKALKKADEGDYRDLIQMQSKIYKG